MKPLILSPASDWLDHTHEQRLRLCIESAYIFDLIDERTFNQATNRLHNRADRARDVVAMERANANREAA